MKPLEYDMSGLSKESSVTILMVSAVRTDVVFSAFAEDIWLLWRAGRSAKTIVRRNNICFI